MMSPSDFAEFEQMFLKGCFDREMADKVHAENPTLQLKDFRMLETMTSTSIKQMEVEAATGTVEEAELASAQSTLDLFKRKLEVELVAWKKYVTAKVEFHNKLRGDKRQHGRSHRKVLERVVQQVQECRFPVQSLDIDICGPWVSEASEDWRLHNVIASTNMWFMYWVDLTKASYHFNSVLRPLSKFLANRMSMTGHNLQSLAIVIAPNCGTYGEGDNNEVVDKAYDTVDGALRDPSLKMVVRRGDLAFQAYKSSTTDRCVHKMWLCMNEAQGADGELLCKFAKSQLWLQSGVVDIGRKMEKDYIVPCPLPQANPHDFGDAQKRKQKISGRALFDKVRMSAFSGLNLSSAHGCVWMDMLGYDPSLIQSVLGESTVLTTAKEPQQAVVTLVPLAEPAGDLEKRKEVKTWLVSAIKNDVDRLLKAGTLKVPEYKATEFVEVGVKPTYDPQEFVMTMPSADECLPMRQTTLDEWLPKFQGHTEAFNKYMEDHNATWNPSGVPYKSGNAPGNKRSCPESSVQEVNPKTFPSEATLANIKEIKGTIHKIPSSQPDVYEVVTTKKLNELFIHALNDGTITTEECLCQVHGHFHTGSEVATAKKKQARLMPIKVESRNYTAVWEHPPFDGIQPFKKGPCPLSDFVAFLEENTKSVKMVCHIFDYPEENDTEDFTIRQGEACSFEPKKMPASAKVEQNNIAAFMDFDAVDWDTGTMPEGSLVTMHKHFGYEDSNQEVGITPQKPGLYFREPHLIKKDEVYKVLWREEK